MHDCFDLRTFGQALARQTAWKPMDSAPKDGSLILALCVHAADPYYLEPENKGQCALTLYGAHTEGLGHVPDGVHVVQWGGAFDDSTWETPGAHLPDWWFQAGSDFEVTASPVAWCPIPGGFEALLQAAVANSAEYTKIS